MRGVTITKKESFDPIIYFKKEPKLLFLAIRDGLDIYYNKIQESSCFGLFCKKKNFAHPRSHQIKIMLESGLGYELLLNSSYFFSKNSPYLPSLINAIEARVVEHKTNLALSNVESFFQRLGKIYSEQKIKDEDSNTPFNKLLKLFHRYKIIFIKESLDFSSIMTLPLRDINSEELSARNLCDIIKLLLKDNNKESYIIWPNEKMETLHISRLNKANFLTELQKNILLSSKEWIKKYLGDNQITLLDETKGFDTEESKKLLGKSNQNFNQLKNQFTEDLGHYDVTIELTGFHNGENYFEFIDLQKKDNRQSDNDFILFLKKSNQLNNENPISLGEIDSISAIVENFIFDKLRKEIKLVITKDNSCLYVPMASVSDTNLCLSYIELALSSLTLNLTANISSDKLSIIFNSPQKIILLMLEVNFLGFKDAFSHLVSKFGHVEEFKGSQTYIVEQKLLSESLYKAESSSARYLKLGREISNEQAFEYLYEIQNVLGDDSFEVALFDGIELIRLNDELSKRESIRPSFFTGFRTQDAKVSLIQRRMQLKEKVPQNEIKFVKNQLRKNTILEKLKSKQGIDNNEFSFLKQNSPHSSKKNNLQILIRGKNESHTELLACFCNYVKIADVCIKDFELPASVAQIIFEYSHSP